jgi:phosphoglycerol transferase MdoB-like AlkP superfamily enzyme
VPAIIYQYLPHFIIVFFLSFLASIFVSRLKPLFKNKALFVLPIIIVSIPFATRDYKSENEFVYFLKSIYQNNKAVDYYQKNTYEGLINNSVIKKALVIKKAEKIKREELPSYLDNIVILQIESLNSFLVNEKNTPNFLEIAKQGVFFPAIYGNSVQTIMAQENILCSLPSSFDSYLTASKKDEDILCLPGALHAAGYKNFFLKSYDLNFTRTGEFMNNIKFDETHADDIMKDGDPKYPWGYREDIFYERAFEYLRKNIKDNNNFIYLEIGPTNHWPFATPGGMENFVPFKNPRNHQERLINTTFLQDAYLKIAWDKLNELFPEKNYTAIITGDHSWPAGIHEGNTFNESGAFEENFLTSMAMILGNDKKYEGKVIKERYSLMDIMPSILNLLGVDFSNNYSRSFIKELNGGQVEEKNIILIQPYAKKYINIVDYPKKYQYIAEEGKILLYDLEKDSGEENGEIISSRESDSLKIMESLFYGTKK